MKHPLQMSELCELSVARLQKWSQQVERRDLVVGEVPTRS
jgi:hypothetical protein